jgi:hypothetical protein
MEIFQQLSDSLPVLRTKCCPIRRLLLSFDPANGFLPAQTSMWRSEPMANLAQLILLALFAVIPVQTITAIDVPPPPPGFTWQEIPELKAAFLKPNGWFFKREEQKGTLAYFITKEDIDKNGQFQTGLTINVFRLKKDSAVERGKSMIDQIAATKHGNKWAQDAGPFREFGCLTRDTDPSGTSVVHTLTVANPKTNTLYLFVFESPESDWDAAWKTGKQIMDTLAIDDEI